MAGFVLRRHGWMVPAEFKPDLRIVSVRPLAVSRALQKQTLNDPVERLATMPLLRPDAAHGVTIRSNAPLDGIFPIVAWLEEYARPTVLEKIWCAICRH